MSMCVVYAVASQKGGVGKTTSAGNLGIELARKGYKVLLIDTDAQGSLTSSLGFKEPDKMDITLKTIIENEVTGEEYDYRTLGILHHEEGVDLIPCNIELSGLEISLIKAWSREQILSKYIFKIKRYYDFIIMNCPPSLSLITINALTAADKVIIPVQAAYLSLKGLEQLITTIGMVKQGLNTRLGIDGILITMLKKRTNYAREIVDLLDETYGNVVHIYKSMIPLSVRAEEASAEGVSIYKHSPKCKVAKAYADFAKEVLGNV